MSNEPITITDTATPYLNFIAETKPDWMRKALKSTGWMMQKAVKQGIRSGAPGGRKYPNFMAPARRAAFESAFGAKLRKAADELNERPGALNREMPYLIWALAPGQ